MRLRSLPLRRAGVRARRAHRLALPAAAVPGRRASRCARSPARRSGSARSSWRVVVGVTVATGGMRSITVVQAFQYWLKLAAIAIPAVLLVAAWYRDGAPVVRRRRLGHAAVGLRRPRVPALLDVLDRARDLPRHDGPAARARALLHEPRRRAPRGARRSSCSALLSVFYLFPPIFGALGRVYTPELAGTPAADTVVLVLPGRGLRRLARRRRSRRSSPPARSPRSSRRRAGCRSRSPACCRRTCCAAESRLGDGVRRFRLGTVIAIVVPFLLALVAGRVDLAQTVTLAFAVAASTFCPLLVLGIWWPRLTVARRDRRARRSGGSTALARGRRGARVRTVPRRGRRAARPARGVDRAARVPRRRSWSRCAAGERVPRTPRRR